MYLQKLIIAAIGWVMLVNSQHTMSNSELVLAYPYPRSSKPVLEFRARPANLKNKSPGHAWVALGREVDDGNTVFYAAGGFYPERFAKVLKGPGEVRFKEDDAFAGDVATIRFLITIEQERTVKFILQNWDEKQYELATQNCVHLMKTVADSVGLNTRGFGNATTPISAVRKLTVNNRIDSALVRGDGERRAQKALREESSRTINSILKEHDRLSRLPSARQDAIRREQFGGASGIGGGDSFDAKMQQNH